MMYQENMSMKCIPPNTLLLYGTFMGFTVVYLFFLFMIQNIDCGYSLEPIYVLSNDI